MANEISEQTIKSICKSAAYGETAERTAMMHGTDVETVKKIWAENPDLVNQYRTFLKEMGCI
jgi:hypothetical protein